MKSSEQGVCWLVGETPLHNAKKSFITVFPCTWIEKSFQFKIPSSSDTQVQLFLTVQLLANTVFASGCFCLFTNVRWKPLANTPVFFRNFNKVYSKIKWFYFKCHNYKFQKSEKDIDVHGYTFCWYNFPWFCSCTIKNIWASQPTFCILSSHKILTIFTFKVVIWFWDWRTLPCNLQARQILYCKDKKQMKLHCWLRSIVLWSEYCWAAKYKMFGKTFPRKS